MGSLRRFRAFLEDVWKEMKRTSWPSKQEVYGTTMVVVACVVVIGIYLGAIDLVLAWIHRLVFFS